MRELRALIGHVLTAEHLTACFGRPVEVSRLGGRRLARSGAGVAGWGEGATQH